jgi:hypothetical protein
MTSQSRVVTTLRKGAEEGDTAPGRGWPPPGQTIAAAHIVTRTIYPAAARFEVFEQHNLRKIAIGKSGGVLRSERVELQPSQRAPS